MEIRYSKPLDEKGKFKCPVNARCEKCGAKLTEKNFGTELSVYDKDLYIAGGTYVCKKCWGKTVAVRITVGV